MPQTPEARRLIKLARQQEDTHLQAARGAVLRQFRKVALKAAEAELSRVLALPPGRRRASLPLVLRRIDEAMTVTRTPPAELTALLKRAVQDRTLTSDDLVKLLDPSLKLNDPASLQVKTVDRQRKQMNTYWESEGKRFKDDAARTVREALRLGLTPEKAADLLQARLGVHRSRAVLIAQDQMLTAASRAGIDRLKTLGVKQFQWETQQDSRVRPGHQALQGRVFTWRGAPELPGHAVMCRCWAAPAQ
ncbi:minor capsid protein [Deinococcus alpinitundrae]|uniref:minor capsid protein n=1 Tax=Deinococcus alpinitundrae TaxID=468913 RepID=UPI001379B586|nr:minor capsid protein [Deinococcus alpinitundrae]